MTQVVPPFVRDEETKEPDEKAYFVVSHSNILQCAVTILDLNDKLTPNALQKSEFDFDQNAWTLELLVANNQLYLENLHDGVAKPKTETDEQPNPLLKYAPSTVPSKNTECVYDTKGYDFTNTLPSQNRDLLMDQDMAGGGFMKKFKKPYIPLPHFKHLEEPCFSTLAQRKQMNALMVDFRYKNVRDPPAPLSFSDSANGARIYISRHANSCNNITNNIFYKKQDPSLSNFGVWSLSSNSKDSNQANVRPKKLDDLYGQRIHHGSPPVYVSSCIRTWQTACLIYKVPFQELQLIVAPFLKEKGSLSGNMPESLDSQRSKMNAWIKRNLSRTNANGQKEVDGNVRIFMQNTAKQTFLIYNPDYWTSKGVKYEYDVEHRSYYPDGIQRFCKWLTDGANPTPVLSTRTRNWLPATPSWNQVKSYVRMPSMTVKRQFPTNDRLEKRGVSIDNPLREGGKRFRLRSQRKKRSRTRSKKR